jgi:hypothetical protein
VPQVPYAPGLKRLVKAPWVHRVHLQLCATRGFQAQTKGCRDSICPKNRTSPAVCFPSPSCLHGSLRGHSRLFSCCHMTLTHGHPGQPLAVNILGHVTVCSGLTSLPTKLMLRLNCSMKQCWEVGPPIIRRGLGHRSGALMNGLISFSGEFSPLSSTCTCLPFYTMWTSPEAANWYHALELPSLQNHEPSHGSSVHPHPPKKPKKPKNLPL